MKTLSKHTPGPWRRGERVVGVTCSHAFHVMAPKGIPAHVFGLTDGMAQANADLIASAPEMFSLLEAIDQFWGDGVCDAAIHPSAYITEQDVPIRDLIHLVVCKAKGIAKP